MAAALAPLIANLVHQTTTGTGTGNLTLATVSGKQSFNTAFSNGATTDVFYYFISNRDASEYEYGTGHMSDATTLVRDTVIESTNANAAVNFSAGTKDVICDVPALRQMVEAEVSLASAGTTDLGTYPSVSVTITGTTTITSFGSTAKTGAIRFVKFSGALQITHNATSMILPNAANYTTAAGDCLIVRHEGSGNWRVLSTPNGLALTLTDTTVNDVSTSKHGFAPKAPNLAYKFLRGDATWAVLPKYLGTVSTGSGATASVTGLGGYEVYFFVLRGVSSSLNFVLQVALSTNGGSSYGTAVGMYPTTLSAASTLSGVAIMVGMQTTGSKGGALMGDNKQGGWVDSGVTGAVDAVQFSPSAGSFDAGNIDVWGI